MMDDYIEQTPLGEMSSSGMSQTISAAASFRVRMVGSPQIARTERQVDYMVYSALLVSLSSGTSSWNAHPCLLNCLHFLLPSECKSTGRKQRVGWSQHARRTQPCLTPSLKTGKELPVPQLRGSNR